MKEQSRTKMLAHDIPLRLVKLLNVILMTIPFAWCWYGYYVGQMENSFYKKGNLLMLVLFMLVYFVCQSIQCIPRVSKSYIRNGLQSGAGGADHRWNHLSGDRTSC